jgi:two-component system nitrate/nitrite response regulator NarL
MSETIRIVIVEDHPLFREGVVLTLRAQNDFEVVGEGSSGEDALRLARDLLPDILLLDIGIPGGGIESARAVAGACPATQIVMLTASDDEENLLAALRAGARAYILKGVMGRELVKIIRDVAAGEVYITPALATSLLVEMTGTLPGSRPAADLFDDLTGRERQILEGVAAGFSNKEIGQKLFLSEKTVKHYMTNILQKLQVRNRVEAALLAQRREQLVKKL